MAAEHLLTPSPGEVAFGADLIAGRLDELARQISGDYRGRDLVLVTVLKGSAIFLADLSRRLTIPHRLDFIAISAYRGASAGSSGRIRLLKDIDRPVRGAHVLIVEDIVDTGLTLNYLFTHAAVPRRRIRRGVHAARPPLPAADRDRAALRRIHRPRCVRCGIRVRLPPALPEPAGHPPARTLSSSRTIDATRSRSWRSP